MSLPGLVFDVAGRLRGGRSGSEKRWDHSVYNPVNGRDGAGRKSKKAKNGLNMKLFTIGYAQKSAKELFDTLKRNGVRKVLDVVHLGGGYAETDCPNLF